jgi:hypothetical protein
MAEFIPGLELSRRFYGEVVRPILGRHFPGLQYAAARIGSGSEVLGFDTPMSSDHDWGPAVSLFVRDADAGLLPALEAALLAELPSHFAGYPVLTPAGADAPSGTPDAYHRVLPMTLRAFVQQQLAHDIDQPLEPVDWLTISSQKLLELTAGAVYHDGVGDLTVLRERLAYYPRDVWLYMLAAGWQRIGQEEHLMPRAGYVGDELGAAIIGSRLARDLISLAFLLERRYAPYPKWFGSAFQQLRCARALAPLLDRARHASHWPERAAALGDACVQLAGMQNELGLAQPARTELVSFFDRPFPVIYGGEIAQLLVAELRDPAVVQIASRRLIGSIDQWSDNTDLRAHAPWRILVKQLYS